MLNFDTHTVLVAFALTLFAGLSTGIGSLIALLAKRTNTRFLSVALGFSAGVMIYVSFVDILAEARMLLTDSIGDPGGTWVTVAGFFGGILLIALIDKFVPASDNPHEMRKVEAMSGIAADKGVCPHHAGHLMRLGLFTALAIAIHNFPEGIATFVAGLKQPTLGISIAIAIAIHNIPEGIAVSVPIYYATGSHRKAFRWSLLSGLSEPLGALVAFLILMRIMTDIVFGIIFACVAGIMVFISLDEILPTARAYGEPHLSIYGMVSGMAVMAVSLLLFM